MKGYIANTDYDWYTFLKQQPDLDEVNFWQPSGGTEFRAIPVGAPFFFKLKQPYNKIVGFGHFAHHSILPAWLAWDSFKEKNGAPDFNAMRQRIERLRRTQESDPAGRYLIGCVMISNPMFFDEGDWVTIPRDFAQSIQRGKTYDLTVGEGRRVWEECIARAGTKQFEGAFKQGESPLSEKESRYGKPVLVELRLGQGTFRVAVTDAYERACAVTGERALPALEASHIRPYAQGGDHLVRNGLLLRSDIHGLFDRGYVTVTPDYQFKASRRLKDEFDNGEAYRQLNDQRIHVPTLSTQRPDPALLEWHNHHVFRQ